jgi:hypothetical protein
MPGNIAMLTKNVTKFTGFDVRRGILSHFPAGDPACGIAV